MFEIAFGVFLGLVITAVAVVGLVQLAATMLSMYDDYVAERRVRRSYGKHY